MALSTYSDLLESVAAWATKSSDTTFVARVPDFIALAEARLASDLTVKAIEQTQQVAIASGTATLPDNVIEVLGMRIVDATYPDVEVTSMERVQLLRDRSYTGPRSYAAFTGRQVHLYPRTTGTLEVRAKCRLPALATNSTNWLLTNYPNAYLFAALMEAANWLADDAAMSRWTVRYAEAVRQANSAITYSGQMGSAKVHGVR